MISKKIKHLTKKQKLMIIISLAFVIWFYFLIPSPLLNVPYSTLIKDRNNNLMGAKIADDGQWRFPVSDSVPYKFKQSLIQFEDAWFYKHPGVNPVSVFKALYQDIKSGKIVRGGSTITMQLARIARKNQRRNVYQKLMEMFWALRLETKFSKNEILNLYASSAPFGGNVVGLEAASWRYFGRSPEKLSWGESAVLAVLPNAPSLIYPGKNHKKLLLKRNRLLDKLFREKIIDSMTCALAKAEELPGKPKPLPRFAPHLLERIIKDGYKGLQTKTSIDLRLQQQINTIASRHHRYLSGSKINNLGILVLDTQTGETLAYIGNVSDPKADGQQVDIITSNRSTGSTLKPFLYALAMKDATILPNMLLPDIPTQIAGYHPENYSHYYDGAVPAGDALARSLNIPAVRLLRKYGLQKFRDNLQKTEIKTIKKPADYYGLTLILGGAEVNLWELTASYADMGRILHNYNNGGKYYKENYLSATYLYRKITKKSQVNDDLFGASNIWFVFDALSKKDRPVEGDDWRIYKSSQRIAWKTGTSFGHRDAWCIGVTPRYTVGVWVGNASGEGRPDITGTQVAAPVMFDVFKVLPKSKWFEKPLEALKTAKICKKSGFLASPNCDETEMQEIPKNGERSEICPYCKIVHLDQTQQKQVNSSCYDVDKIQNVSWFILPPIQAYYYKKKYSEYRSLPPFEANCKVNHLQEMAVIYPKNGNQIFLPKDFNNIQQEIVLKAVHHNPNTIIYWHLDNKYIGQTQRKHKMALYIKPGRHLLTLIDEKGNIVKVRFEVVN